MADTKEQEPKVVGAADPGATPRGEEPKVVPDPAAPPKGKEPKPKKPKKGPGGEARPAEPEGPPPEPAPPPRLHEYYEQRVRRSEEHTSELQSPCNLVCRLLLEKKKKKHAWNPSGID